MWSLTLALGRHLCKTQGASDPRCGGGGGEALSPKSSWVFRTSPHPRDEVSAQSWPVELSAVLTPPIPVGTALGNLCLLGLGVGWPAGQMGPRIAAPT